MARFRKSFRRFRKRMRRAKRGRHRSGYKPASRLTYFGNGIADRYTCNMVFTDTFSMDSAGSSLAAHISYRGNGMFDPEQASGFGQTQPLYFDQLSALYEKYYVHSSRIVVKCAVPVSSTLTASPTLVCVHPQHQAVGSVNINTSIQQPRAKYRLITMSTDICRIVNRATTKAMLPYRTGNLLGTDGADPQNQWYWVISSQGADPDNQDSLVEGIVEIYYTVTWYERKNQSLS